MRLPMTALIMIYIKDRGNIACDKEKRCILSIVSNDLITRIQLENTMSNARLKSTLVVIQLHVEMLMPLTLVKSAKYQSEKLCSDLQRPDMISSFISCPLSTL